MRRTSYGSLLVTLGLLTVLWWGQPAVHAGQRSSQGSAPATALFSMYCYWTGEASLGLVPGVLATRIGEMGGEVVEVTYDPDRTDPGRLAASLRRHGGFYALIVPDREAQARALAYLPAAEIQVRDGRPRFLESKYSLRTQHPELYALGLTEAQAIALNSWSYFGGPRPDVLTPEQKALLGRGR